MTDWFRLVVSGPDAAALTATRTIFAGWRVRAGAMLPVRAAALEREDDRHIERSAEACIEPSVDSVVNS